MEGLPQDYVIQKLYSFCKRPVYKKFQGTYNAECCICHEGSSAGSKRRLFYFPSERYFYCFNCSRSWSELNWIQEVTGKNYHEVLKDSKAFDGAVNLVTMLSAVEDKKEYTISSIPEDSVDLTDSKQCDYYKGTTQYRLLQRALDYCIKRKLFTAVNRPNSFYISFNDYVHKNRLIIPFYSDSTCISTYVKSTDIKQSALNFIPASIKVEGKSVNIFYTGSGNGIRNSCSAKFPIIPVANYNNITGKIGPVDYSWVIRYNLPTIDSYNNHLPGIGGAFVTMLI